jgi:hypothetical protein
MKSLTPKQVGFVVKYGYELVLELKHKVVFPMVIIDWVMDKMVPELAMFRHEHKRINFDKNMMQQFVGIPAGILFVFVRQDGACAVLFAG